MAYLGEFDGPRQRAPSPDRRPGDDANLYAWGATALVSLTVTALMLSLAGIYSIMAFTVSRRTREIGIRVALGADRGRLVAAIFRRPLTQVVIGIAARAVLLVQAGQYLFAVSGLTPGQYAWVALHAAGAGRGTGGGAQCGGLRCRIAPTERPAARAAAVEGTRSPRWNGGKREWE